MQELPKKIQALYPFKNDASRYHDIGRGHRMHYVDEGSGEPVVMVHGNPTWSFYYRNLILSLRDYCRCIAPDHIGCGLSDKPQHYPYRLQDHIDNLFRLLEHLKIQHFHLVVHDWGGAIGMAVAEKWLTRVRSLVILNSAAFPSQHIPARIKMCQYPVIGPLLVRGLNGFARAATFMATQQGLDSDVKGGYLYPYSNWANRVATLRFVQDIPMHSGHPSYAVLQRIEQALWTLQHKPVFIGWGMKDFCFTPEFLDSWKSYFPEANVNPFPDAGHYVLEDAGENLIPLIRKFIISHTSIDVYHKTP